MKILRIHKRDVDDPTVFRGHCGERDVPIERLTNDWKKVNCKQCRKQGLNEPYPWEAIQRHWNKGDWMNFSGLKYLRPHYYGYRIGSWANCTRCEDCNLVGLYEDCHPANPCHSCGGKRIDGLVGRWIVTSSKWKFWSKKGYWELKSAYKWAHIAKQPVVPEWRK